tara:strand:+ start:347 stop:946 length:600 start_codon:yes stop_codon:yes gene_type:complete
MLPIKSKYKVARRLGPVFEKTQGQKFALRQQRKRPVGRRRNVSEYGKQLLEKQKLRVTYGLKEKKLASYIKETLSSREDSIPYLYQLLETRLDSVVYQAGFASTRRMARQLVSHGHITVNGRKNNVASTRVKEGDVIGIRKGSMEKPVFATLSDYYKTYKAPAWLKIDQSAFSATVAEMPKENVASGFDFKKIIEFYTR